MLNAVWNTVTLQRLTRYRAVSLSLALLWLVALVLSFFGLVLPSTLELVVGTAVLLLVTVAAELLARLITSRGIGIESAVITALILSFALRLTLSVEALIGLALAGVVAVASKYLLRVNGRHIFNPAAFAVFVVLLTQTAEVAWWVAAPVLFPAVLLFALLVVARLRQWWMFLAFVLFALAATVLRELFQSAEFGMAFAPLDALYFALASAPILFIGAFMMTEPATLPPRRWQRIVIASLAGILLGGAFGAGVWFIGPDRSVLIANLLALVFSLWAARRRALRATVTANSALSDRVRILSLETPCGFNFKAGQYLELEIPHTRADARGTRRELSIVSAPAELPALRIALAQHPDSEGKVSSFKQRLSQYRAGDWVRLSGAWGDFTLPSDRSVPILLVAGGVGITPFVSQLRQESADRAAGLAPRDIVLLWAVRHREQIVFNSEDFAAARVILSAKADLALPEQWELSLAGRLGAADLAVLVPDLHKRRAFISGSLAFVKGISPELGAAQSLHKDVFNGL